jgi:hypothetical protein
MKANLFRTVLVAMVALTVISSCKKETDITDDENKNSVLEKFMEFRAKMGMGLGSNDAMEAIGASELNRGGKALRIKSFLGDSTDIDDTDGDSTYIDSSYWNDSIDYWEYVTCAQVTETINDDGTVTTVYDYGDGCDEYGSLISGKITYVWRNDANTYYSKITYENYSAYGMTMHGESEYSFTNTGDNWYTILPVEDDYENGDTIVKPEIIYNWSGSSTGKDNMIITFDTGESYAYSAEYANEWDNNSSTVSVGTYTFKSSNGEEYRYAIVEPMFYNYECMDSWIAVSGIETMFYKGTDGVVYNFTIDYGDGTCDNLASVTENGETTVVDFGDLFYNIEVCYDNSDGTNSEPANPGKRFIR